MSLSKDISLDYIEYIRSHNHCCVCLKQTDIEPHHLNAVGMGRNRKKPMIEHFSAVPVCRPCHIEYHQKGLEIFESTHKQNMYKTSHMYLSKFIDQLGNLDTTIREI